MTRPSRPAAPRGQQRALIAALRRQDSRALDALLDAYGSMLRGFLTEAVGDRDATEDVLQQTLIEVWRRGPTYDPARSSLATWLLIIARSRAIDHRRRRVPEPVDPSTLSTVADPGTDDGLEALAERWRIAGLLAALPREEARILALRFHGGLSQSEIATRTGLPLGTVKMRMAQGLERLRAALQAEEGRA